jgi:hypothetical protein
MTYKINPSEHMFTTQKHMQIQNIISIGLWMLGRTCQHHRKEVVWVIKQPLFSIHINVEANTFMPLSKLANYAKHIA